MLKMIFDISILARADIENTNINIRDMTHIISMRTHQAKFYFDLLCCEKIGGVPLVVLFMTFIIGKLNTSGQAEREPDGERTR